MQEIHALAQARRIALADDKVTTCLTLLRRQPPEGTTSLQRDIIAGRPSELDAWSGAVVRLGRQAGVATPVHRFIYHSLLPQELRARGKLTFAVSALG
jgi:2-dehydropantoate 2-reductase